MDCCHIDVLNTGGGGAWDDTRIKSEFDTWAANIWNGSDPGYLPHTIIEAYSNILKSAIKEGWQSTDVVPVDWRTKDPLRYAVMEMNVSRFAHAKTEKAALWINEMARKSSTFNEFKQNMDIVGNVYNGTWLRAEYNLAWATGQNGAKYMRHVKEQDIFPYVRYQTIGDARVRDAHRILDGKVFLVGSKAYDYIMPPNGWGCRCELNQVLESEVVPGSDVGESKTIELLKKGGDFDKMQKGGFLVNRAKTGRVFNERDIPTNKPDIKVKPIEPKKPIIADPPSLPGKPPRLPGESDTDYLVRINRKAARAKRRAERPPEPVKPLPQDPTSKKIDDIRKAQEQREKFEADYLKRKAAREAAKRAAEKAAIDKQLKDLQRVKKKQELSGSKFGFGDEKTPETYGAPSGKFGVDNYDPVKMKRHPYPIDPDFWGFVEKDTYVGSFKSKGAFFSPRTAIKPRGSSYLRDESGDIITGRMVNIPKGARYKRSKHYQSNIMYHEFGHSIHHSTQTVTTGFGSSKIHPKIQGFLDKWEKKVMPKVEKTTPSPRGRSRYYSQPGELPEISYKDNFNGWDDQRAFYKLKDTNPDLWSKLTALGEDEHGIWEMWGAMTDTLEAITKGKAGYGHGKAYFSGSGKSAAELFAHMTEITFLDNPVWRTIWPELYDDLQALGMEFYKRKSKPKNIIDL